MSGCGFCQAGFSPAGFGDVDLAGVPNFKLFVDQNGVAQNARRIDPATMQYVLASSGAYQGMSAVAQKVYIAVKTVLDSSAIAGLGLRRLRTVVTPTLVKDITNAITDALKPYIDAGEVAIRNITVFQDTTTRERAHVYWTDLTTGRDEDFGV